MAYRFRRGDRSVQQALRRIAREQIDDALAAIAARSHDVATHEVRKACKKLRALIRLVRPAFPDYARENAAFRDMARLLSGTRDAKILLDTFDLLAADAPDAAAFAPWREEFARDLEHLSHGRNAAARLRQARTLLEAARERVGHWSLQGKGWDALERGLGKIVRRAAKAARKAAQEPTALHYHELRKLMKHHWYHTRLLVPLWPRMMGSRAEELSRLADLLGLHHDIAVFEARIGDTSPDSAHADQARALLALARKRCEELEQEVALPVARLLAQKAEALVRHWSTLWQIWHDHAEHGA